MSITKVIYPFFLSLAITSCTCSPTDRAESEGQSSNEDEVNPTENRVVNLAIWSNYITDELLAHFERDHGIKVQMSNYSSNEELLAKMQAGATGIDVAVPSDYMVSIMTHLKLLQELEQAKLPNAKEVDPTFLNKSYDPKNTYAYPYNWVFTGIAINRNFYKGGVKSWKDFLGQTAFDTKVSLLDDARETIGAALKTMNYSLNTVSKDELGKAQKVLGKVRNKVRAFTSEPLDSILQGEVAVAQIYSSDALIARHRSGGKIDLIIPEEGGSMAIDNLVIPKSAANVEEAHELINFLLSSMVSESRAVNNFAGPVIKGVREKLPPTLRDDPLLFPSPQQMAKFEMIVDLGDDSALYDKIWTEIKAGLAAQ